MAATKKPTAREEQIDQLNAEIVMLHARKEELEKQVLQLRQEQRKEDATAVLDKLPEEVVAMLRRERPRAEDMKRLSARKLAYSSGGAGTWASTSYHWTPLGRDVREVLAERDKK